MTKTIQEPKHGLNGKDMAFSLRFDDGLQQRLQILAPDHGEPMPPTRKKKKNKSWTGQTKNRSPRVDTMMCTNCNKLQTATNCKHLKQVMKSAWPLIDAPLAIFKDIFRESHRCDICDICDPNE